MTDEEERDRAIYDGEDVYGSYNIGSELANQIPTLPATALKFVLGRAFDAGVAHERKRWNVIETAYDLPKTYGNFLWQRHDGRIYWHDYVAASSNDYFIEHFIAWKEVAPYSKDGGQRDD